MIAGRWPLEGSDVGELAEIVGACLSSVRRCHRAVEKGALEALKAKPHPGPKPRLNPKQKQQRDAKALLRSFFEHAEQSLQQSIGYAGVNRRTTPQGSFVFSFRANAETVERRSLSNRTQGEL